MTLILLVLSNLSSGPRKLTSLEPHPRTRSLLHYPWGTTLLLHALHSTRLLLCRLKTANLLPKLSLFLTASLRDHFWNSKSLHSKIRGKILSGSRNSPRISLPSPPLLSTQTTIPLLWQSPSKTLLQEYVIKKVCSHSH
jgi:hypothetical protein